MTEISELRRLNAVHWVRLPQGAEAPFAVYVNGSPRENIAAASMRKLSEALVETRYRRTFRILA